MKASLRTLTKLVLAVALALPLSACFGYVKPTEGDRQLNNQNIGAAATIDEVAVALSAVLPGPSAMISEALIALRTTAKDIKDNSGTLEKNLNLKPEKPEPYTHEASARWRKKAEEEHAEPWWSSVLKYLGTALVGGGVMSFLVRLFPTIFGGPVGGAVVGMVEAIAKLRHKAEGSPTADGIATPPVPLQITDILGELKKQLENMGAQRYVQKLTEKAEDKLGLKLKIKLPG